MKESLDLLEESSSITPNYRAILRRRRWYILAPLLLCGLVGSIVARKWPLLYRSEALILVEQQKVPEQYVTPNIITNLQDRLDGMTQEIESRTRLSAMIDRFGLYSRERATMPMDDIVDKMRRNISVTLVQAAGRQGVTAFRISYTSDSARLAQLITNELTTMFINQSSIQRTEQSAGTTRFLQSELDAAQRELAVQEQRLREYKLQFVGELPQQEQGNLQLLSSTQAQLYAGAAAVQRAEQQKIYLEAMKAEYLAMNTPTVSPDGTVVAPADVGRSAAMLQLERQIDDTERQLSELRPLYTPSWQKIVQLDGALAFLKNKKKDLEAAETAKGPGGTTTMPGRPASSAAVRLNMAELDSRLKSTAIEVENLKKDQTELVARIQDLQKRLNMTPIREQQLTEITRTYENTRLQYQSLLQKKVQSELASNLDKRQQGEQFRILDPPRLPEKPEGRLRILGAGWLLGLCLGFGLAALREFTSGRVNDDADVKALTTLPVFRIPVIRTERELATKKMRFAMECLSAAILVLASVLASAQTYLTS